MIHQVAIEESPELNEGVISLGSFKTKKGIGKQLLLKDFAFEQLIPGLLLSSPPMKKVAEMLKCVAATDSTVLLHGETGTGKELFASAVHLFSQRRNNNFTVVDCCALNKEIEDSELFGHVAGSFTGALGSRIGLLEEADRGTVFLDEISELNSVQQGKLLRFLETKTIRKVGTSKFISLDVRIVSASNKNLAQMVNRGLFREDLYHRLNGVCLNLPPLRHRPEDVPLLSAYFLNKVGITEVFQKFAEMMVAHDWSGNVRELKQTLERSAIFHRKGSMLTDVQIERRINENPQEELRLHHVIKNHLQRILDMHNGCQRSAAVDLDISARVLNYQKKVYGLKIRNGRSGEDD